MIDLLRAMAEATSDLLRPEVQILETPWSGGRTIESYYGPVQVVIRVPSHPRGDRSERIFAGISEAVEQMRHIAASRGANAIASPALDIDPFGDDIEIRAGASAFELRANGAKRGLPPVASGRQDSWL